MSIVQERIAAWLARTVPERALSQCHDLAVVLTTDIGLHRSENQDRVAALRVSGKATDNQPLIAVAVADGMGGMRDGAACANLALSSFFYALVLNRTFGIEERTLAAMRHANDAVFNFAKGKGGATLSAVLLDRESRPFIAHLGDTRIYAFGGSTDINRLTIDDSLAEAVGGHGRELLQFVGMGEGMQPHVKPISADIPKLAITTDGIHFIEASTLASVLMHSPSLRAASERLAALARWCGGPDNASSALVDLKSLTQDVHAGTENAVELWDPFGSVKMMWIRTDNSSALDYHSKAEAPAVVQAVQVTEPTPEVVQASRPKRKPQTKKSRGDKQPVLSKGDIQLKIEIEQSADPEEPDENRQ
jgi:PPM family protein phosphatase